MSLDFRTSLTQLDKAVKWQLLLAYGQRISPASVSTTNIKGIASAGLKGDELNYVNSKGVTYIFDRFSTLADDGDTVLKPTDNPASGRWRKTTSAVSTGYLKTVRIHAGDESFSSLMKRGLALRPSIHIIFDSYDFKDRSSIKGALYWVTASYKLAAVSSSYRYLAEAIEGSDVATEAASDPGTHDIVGDILVSLAGSDLTSNGYSTITGVAWVQPRIEKVKISEIGGRLFMEEIFIDVYATVHQPDTSPVILDGLTPIQVQYELLGGNPYSAALAFTAGAYSSISYSYNFASSYVQSGYTVPTGTVLSIAPLSGTAVLSGTTISSAPSAHAFSVNSDTYRDLKSDGTFVYTSVNNGLAAPIQTTSTLRVGVTVTDGSSIIYDKLLAPVLKNYGGVDYALGAGLGVQSISVTAATTALSIGLTLAISALAYYSTNATNVVTNFAAWSCSPTSVGTINALGTFTAVSTGTATINCAVNDLNSNSITISVS